MKRNNKLLSNKDKIYSILGLINEPTSKEIECINQRQFKLYRPLAITKGLCKYNYPQVTIQYPVDIKSNKLASGMIRLTCPHLVKEIDQYEKEGGVAKFNEEIVINDKAKEDFENAHKEWKEIRDLSMTKEEVNFVKDKCRDRADDFLTSGFLGITMGRIDDVKCLHAHTADYLIRQNKNSIGKKVIEKLIERGVDPSGCNDCWQQCDVRIPKEDTVWWYASEKNRSKLTQRRQRNRAIKRKILEKRNKLESSNSNSDSENSNNSDSNNNNEKSVENTEINHKEVYQSNNK